ncbi:MAG: hypothetical protein AAF739_05135 [Pseudomonadota bacterium]
MPFFAQMRTSDISRHLPDSRLRALYNLYQAELSECTKKGATLPALSVVGAEHYLGLQPWVVRVAVLEDGDFIYHEFGSKVIEAAGFSMLGKRLSSGHGRPFAFFREAYGKVVQNRQPMLAENAAVLAPNVGSWTRLLLPVRDEAQQINIVGVLSARSNEQCMADALLEANNEATLVIELVRNRAAEVVDARVTASNFRAQELLGMKGARHVHLSDLMPDPLSAPFFPTVVTAYRDEGRARFNGNFSLKDNEFRALTATRCGDGAVLILHALRQPAFATESTSAAA